MKQYTNRIWASCLLLCSLLFFSCSDDDDKDDNVIVTETSVSFDNSGVNDYVVYDKGKGDLYSFELDIRKSGKLSNSASVTLEVVMTNELNAYNTANGTDFVRLAPKYYEIEAMNVPFEANDKDVLQKVKVNFNIPEMDATATNKVLAIKISSATVSIDSKKAICIIRPQINQSVFRLESPQVNTINVDIDHPENFEYDIATTYNIDKNEWDVSVELEADQDYVTAYNKANGTNFVLAPTGSFQLETSKTLTVDETTLSFNLKGSTASMDKSCILPIRLKSSSRYDVDQDEYFVLIFNVPQYTSELLSRTNWTIAQISSEAPGDGGGGLGTHAIDGNNSTFWHSKWSGGFAQLPHWLVVDMHQEFTITQVALRQRWGGNTTDTQTKTVEFYICKDIANPEWVKVGTFTLQRIGDDQKFNITRTTGRYLKINIIESYKGDQSASIAEINAYGYQK